LDQTQSLVGLLGQAARASALLAHFFYGGLFQGNTKQTGACARSAPGKENQRFSLHPHRSPAQSTLRSAAKRGRGKERNYTKKGFLLIRI